MSFATISVYVITGILAGVASAMFGVGGGIIIVPSLIYLAGFSQLQANGTSLAVLVIPVGLAAMIEYHRHGYVNFPAAIIIAISLLLSAWVSAKFTVNFNQSAIKIIFGVFLTCLGIYTIVSTVLKDKM